MGLDSAGQITQFFLNDEVEAVEAGDHMAQSYPLLLQLLLAHDGPRERVLPRVSPRLVNTTEFGL